MLTIVMHCSLPGEGRRIVLMVPDYPDPDEGGHHDDRGNWIISDGEFSPLPPHIH